MAMVKALGSWIQELRRRVRLARNRNAQLRRELEQQEFEDREARHAAGIYEPPPANGPGAGF